MRLAFLILAAFLASGCTSYAFLSEQQIESTETVVDHDLTQAEAYTRLRRWAAETYTSADAAIQMDDPASGTLVVRGSEAFGGAGRFGYTMSMDVREERVRIRQTPGTFTAATGMAAGDWGNAGAYRARVAEVLAALRVSAQAALASDDSF